MVRVAVVVASTLPSAARAVIVYVTEPGDATQTLQVAAEEVGHTGVEPEAEVAAKLGPDTSTVAAGPSVDQVSTGALGRR